MNDLPEPTYDPRKSYLVKGKDLNAIIRAILRRTPLAGDNITLDEDSAGIFIHATGSGGESGSSTADFCSLYQDAEDNWFFTGGYVGAGDKNFNVPPYSVSVASDGTKLLYVEVPVEVFRDDDNVVILPGIKTSSASSLDIADTSSDDYPDSTNPEVDDGLGTIILPVGQLTVLDGEPTVQATRCGGFVVTQCGGSLGFKRV